MRIDIQGTTACFPGLAHREAVARLRTGAREPLFGGLRLAHCQLCPQNHGIVDETLCETLQRESPGTRFRLHANVRAFPTQHRFDAAAFGPDTRDYFKRLATLSQALGSEVYSLHAGKRQNATLVELSDRVRALSDVFGHCVAVEGLYPVRGNVWLLSTWSEYRWLLESKLDYALDLSHVAIVARRERTIDTALLNELLASPHCREIHVSDNDGYRDQHRVLEGAPWWWRSLEHALPNNDDVVVFSEGNQRREPNREVQLAPRVRSVNSRRIHPIKELQPGAPPSIL